MALVLGCVIVSELVEVRCLIYICLLLKSFIAVLSSARSMGSASRGPPVFEN